MADPQVQEVDPNTDEVKKPDLEDPPVEPGVEDLENVDSTVKTEGKNGNESETKEPESTETNGEVPEVPKEDAEQVEEDKPPEPLPYDGPPRKNRKRNRNRTKAARAVMGVGKMLEQYRQLITEQGPLDVDEDYAGNFQIGGCDLSFETWGQVTKTQDDGIVRADFVPPSQKITKRNVSPIEWVHLGKAKPSTSNGHNKKKKGDDRDEGEISDSDDQSDDSISSDSDDEAPRHHKKRRRPLPKAEPAPQGNMSLMSLFTSAYKFRENVVQSFTLSEKMSFLEAVTQR